MRTVFVDTNVVLDVLLQRDVFWQDALKIFRLAELGELRACVSASSITDIFYVARKTLTTPVARAAIDKLLYLFEVVGVGIDDLRGALALPIDDVEDALVTRDVGVFKDIGIAVVTPAGYGL